MRRFIFVALAACGNLAAATWRAHPEWGPPPPVAPFGTTPLPSIHHVVGMYFPLIGPCHLRNDYNQNRGRYRHTGVDIGAAKMTPIVAPFSGRIGIKRESFWIWGDDGWAMLGTHLNDDNLGRHDHGGNRDVMFAPNLVAGQRVEAGQFIGYVGMSGNATGPHLHFELYAPGPEPITQRIRNPFASLKDAMLLSHPKVSIPDPADTPNWGNIRLDACIRGTSESNGGLYVILVAAQRAHGGPHVVTQPRFVRLRVPEAVANEAGGWEYLSHLPITQTISAYVSDVPDLNGQTVLRLRVNQA